jgi:ABC-type branched-subunit amino acid transport system substrate-binding protein
MTVAPFDVPEINLKDFVLVGQYAARWINERGGINGRQINVIVCNDSFRADGAQTCARQAVAQNAVALVGGISIFDGGMLPILEAAKIPWLGELPFQTLAYTSPVSYPIVNGGFYRTALAAQAARDCQRVALVDAGQGSAADIPFLNAGMKSEGKAFLSPRVSVKASAPDFSGYAAQVKATNPECLLLDINSIATQRLIPALQQIGVPVNKVYSVTDNVLSPDVVKLLGSTLNGWVACSWFSDTNAKEWADYRAAVDKYHLLAEFPTAKIGTNGEANTWASYQLLKAAVSKVQGDVTGAKLIDVLDHSNKLNFGDLMPAIDFTKPNSNPAFARIFNRYSTVLTIQNGATQPGRYIDAQAIYEKGS